MYYCILAVCVDGDIGVVSRIILQNTDLEISLVSSCWSVPHSAQNYRTTTELVDPYRDCLYEPHIYQQVPDQQSNYGLGSA